MIATTQVHGDTTGSSDGLGLPWRTRKAARTGEENFLSFQSVSVVEIRLLPKNAGGGMLVVPRGEEKPHRLWIEPEWILGREILLTQPRGRVQPKEFTDAQ